MPSSRRLSWCHEWDSGRVLVPFTQSHARAHPQSHPWSCPSSPPSSAHQLHVTHCTALHAHTRYIVLAPLRATYPHAHRRGRGEREARGGVLRGRGRASRSWRTWWTLCNAHATAAHNTSALLACFQRAQLAEAVTAAACKCPSLAALSHADVGRRPLSL